MTLNKKLNTGCFLSQKFYYIKINQIPTIIHLFFLKEHEQFRKIIIKKPASNIGSSITPVKISYPFFFIANQEDGVTLLDFRKPNKPILKYGDRKLRKRSAMCARFSPDGSKIFALGRRFNPVLYDLAHPKALVEFDHPGYFNR